MRGSSEHLGPEIASEKLHTIIAAWRQQIERLPPQPTDSNSNGVMPEVVYLLEHEYAQVSISLKALKHGDLLRAQQLHIICDQYEFTLYLASLEREVTGQADEDACGDSFDELDEDDEDECDSAGDLKSLSSRGSYHKIWDICDESLQLTRMVDIDGNEVFRVIPIDENDILQVRPFKRKPN